MAATIVRQFQQAGRAHTELRHSFVAYCHQSHNDPDLCPEAAAAFASLIEEYRELATKLELEDWGDDLTQEVANHFEKLLPDDASRSFMTQQPALVAKLVMAGWEPRDKTGKTGNHYGAYYTSMINRARLEVPTWRPALNYLRPYQTI